jgi:nitric oxide reductase NorD protein
VPEAEDVVLEAAERAARTLRALWERSPSPGAHPAVRFAREGRRLDAWLRACFGRSWPLTLADAPLPPRWLARALGRPAPWARVPVAAASSDGHRIVLPREPASSDSGLEANDLRLLMALGLGARLDRSSVALCPSEPVARDIFWSVEGALADARVVRELPGLAERLGAARADARRARPGASLLRPSERAVEALVRLLLERAPSAALAEVLPDDPSPAGVLLFAERLAQALPAAERARHRGLAPVAHWGVPRPDLSAHATSASPPPASGSPPPGRARTLSRRVEPRRPDPEELAGRPGPFVLPFGDPQLSVQDPSGVVRPTDQGDEPDLDALAEELSRLERAPRVEAEGAVREVLASEEELTDARAPAATPREVDDATFVYPEWDYRQGGYRADHCRVQERAAPPGDADLAARMAAARASVTRQLRRRFEALRPRRVRRPRELEGDSVDLDAWHDDWTALRAGRSPDGRIYTKERRERRDVAVALLLDTSGSTDTWVSGRARVIDVEKDALVCFCEALGALGDRHAVLSFSSHGPGGVRVLRVKGFRERLGDAVRARIAGLEPDGFTRLGAALRHATALLDREPARARVLLVLSDAKPYDEDEYAGDYGIEDARQAVVEATLAGVRVFCVNVDHGGPAHLPRIFGPRGATTLWNVEQLPSRLPELYRHLTAGL